jgi:hypothetical protein
MTRAWRVDHACFLRWVEGAAGVAVQLPAWVSGNVRCEANCRKPSTCDLCLSGGDKPAETGP